MGSVILNPPEWLFGRSGEWLRDFFLKKQSELLWQPTVANSGYSPAVGLFRGLLAPFRGAAFIVRHRLWGYLVLPVIINLGLAYFAYKGAQVFIIWFFDVTEPPTDLPSRFAANSGAVVAALLLFIALQPLVSAPFIDALTEKTERIVRGTTPKVGFFRSVVLAFGHGLLKLLLYGAGLVMTFGLSFATGWGGVVGVIVTALFLAYDGFDYPLARRDVGFFGKWAYLVRNPGLTVGYATGTMFCYTVPLAALLIPSLAAVGATLAYLSQEEGRLPPAPELGSVQGHGKLPGT